MSTKTRIKNAVIKLFSNQTAVTGDVTGNVTGDLTGNSAGVHTGAVVGNITGGQKLPTATVYNGADAAGKAILPSVYHAQLSKGSAGTDYTLAAPGAANVDHILHITSTGAYAHVVTVTGLVGGNTMTFGAAVGNGFDLLAVSTTVWRLCGAAVGITQTAV
jgi:hypothetical protein